MISRCGILLFRRRALSKNSASPFLLYCRWMSRDGGEATVTPRVLWIADQSDDIAASERLSITEARTPGNGFEHLRAQEFDVILVSWPLADWPSAESLLEALQQAQPGTPVVIHAPAISSTETVRLLRLGAFHVLHSEDAT